MVMLMVVLISEISVATHLPQVGFTKLVDFQLFVGAEIETSMAMAEPRRRFASHHFLQPC